MASRNVRAPSRSSYQLGLGSEPVTVVGSSTSFVARYIGSVSPPDIGCKIIDHDAPRVVYCAGDRTDVSRDGIRPWSRWLRRYRDERDLTQEELGDVLDVDGKTVSAWENGQRPGRRHARTICARLRTTRAELGLAEPEEGPVVARREFFRLSAGVGWLALFGPWAGVDPVDAPTLEGFEAA